MVQIQRYELAKQQNDTVITLFIQQGMEEFAEEFGSSRKKQDSVQKTAESYLRNRFPNVKKATVRVMVGTMLVGVFSFTAAGKLEPIKASAEENTMQATADTEVEVTLPDTDFKDAGDFTDINDEHEFYKFVEDFANRGIVKGYGDHFAVYEDMTRAQAAKVIALVIGFNPEEVENPNFKDVTDTKNAWAIPYVSFLENEGVIKGYGEGDNREFRPNEKVTRAQMAKMLVQAFKLADDVKEGTGAGWANNYIEVLIDKGITSMESPDAFRGGDTTYRGHLVKFVYQSELAKGNIGSITDVSDDSISVTLPGGNSATYPLTDETNKILNPTNSAALEDAEISVKFNDEGEISEILELTINAEGTAESQLTLDGGDTVVKNLIANGDFLEIKKLTVDDDLEITPNVENSFQASSVNIGLNTIIQESGNFTAAADYAGISAVFKESNLRNVLVKKDGVTIEQADGSTISKYLVQADSKIVTDDTSLIGTVKLQGKTKNVEMNGNVSNIDLDADQAVAIKGNAVVANVSLPKGKSISDVIKNYDEVKQNIIKIDGEKNEDSRYEIDEDTGDVTEIGAEPDAEATNPDLRDVVVNGTNFTPEMFENIKITAGELNAIDNFTVRTTEEAADIDVTVTTTLANGTVVHEILAKEQNVSEVNLDMAELKAKYGELPAGEYQFTIKLTNNKGEVEEINATLDATKGTEADAPVENDDTTDVANPAVPKDLDVEYEAASENVIVSFKVDNELDLKPITGTTDIAAITSLYTTLADKMVNGTDEEIKDAAEAIGDDVITEYYYLDDDGKKVYLKTTNDGDLVKNKYWEGYLVIGNDKYPTTENTLIPADTEILTSTNQHTGTVSEGWLNDVKGKELIVKVTVIDDGNVSSSEHKVQIPE